MNKYQINNLSPTIGYFSASLIAAALITSPQTATAGKSQKLDLKPSTYHGSSLGFTYDQYSNIFTGEFVTSTDPLIDAITSVYSNLLTTQERLEPEFEQLLHDNLWDLYEC
jgi:hypothetical protein